MKYKGINIELTGWGPDWNTTVTYTSSTVNYGWSSAVSSNWSSSAGGPYWNPSPTPCGLSAFCILPNGVKLEESLMEEDIKKILTDRLKQKIEKYLTHKNELDGMAKLGEGSKTLRRLLEDG